MAKQYTLVIALIAALGAGLSEASPRWGRYDQPGAERIIPGAHPGNPDGPPPVPQQYGSPEQENARRAAARMSPEQRRDLRRQINEAGQDIYSRPRR